MAIARRDAVLDFHLAHLETVRTSAARSCSSGRGGTLPEPALDALEPFAIAQAEVFVADPLAARKQLISELQPARSACSVRESRTIRRVARAVLQLQDFEVPLANIRPSRLQGEAWAVQNVGQLIASSSASLVPDPTEKCAVCAASPSKMTLPVDQRCYLMRRKLSPGRRAARCAALDCSEWPSRYLVEQFLAGRIARSVHAGRIRNAPRLFRHSRR